MIWPLAAVAATTIVSGILQYKNSEAARKASSAERARLDELLQKINRPNFDFSTFTPEDYKVVQKYVPQASSFVQEVAPQSVTADTADAQLGRGAGRNALLRLQQEASNEAENKALFEQAALKQAVAQAAAQDATLRQDFATRGSQFGSGMELASRMNAQQQGQEAAANAGLQAQIEARRNALQSLAQAADLGSRIRGEDVALSEKNADIINAYNARQAQRRQTWQEGNVDRMNQGQQYNIGMTQDIANKNVAGRNTAALQNINNQNDLRQRQYENEMSNYRAAAGLSDANRSDIRQNAQDRNQLISGIAGGITSAAGYVSAKQDEANKQDREDARWAKYYQK